MEPLTILQAIDRILQNVIVRWALFGSTVLLLIFVIICKVRLTAYGLQLDSANGKAATCASSLEQQNAAIVEQGKAFKALEAKLKAVKAAPVVPVVIKQGSCEDMVQQAIDEVRR